MTKELQKFNSEVGYFAEQKCWLEHLFDMCLMYIYRYILETRRL